MTPPSAANDFNSMLLSISAPLASQQSPASPTAQLSSSMERRRGHHSASVRSNAYHPYAGTSLHEQRRTSLTSHSLGTIFEAPRTVSTTQHLPADASSMPLNFAPGVHDLMDTGSLLDDSLLERRFSDGSVYASAMAMPLSVEEQFIASMEMETYAMTDGEPTFGSDLGSLLASSPAQPADTAMFGSDSLHNDALRLPTFQGEAISLTTRRGQGRLSPIVSHVPMPGARAYYPYQSMPMYGLSAGHTPLATPTTAVSTATSSAMASGRESPAQSSDSATLANRTASQTPVLTQPLYALNKMDEEESKAYGMLFSRPPAAAAGEPWNAPESPFKMDPMDLKAFLNSIGSSDSSPDEQPAPYAYVSPNMIDGSVAMAIAASNVLVPSAVAALTKAKRPMPQLHKRTQSWAPTSLKSPLSATVQPSMAEGSVLNLRKQSLPGYGVPTAMDDLARSMYMDTLKQSAAMAKSQSAGTPKVDYTNAYNSSAGYTSPAKKSALDTPSPMLADVSFVSSDDVATALTPVVERYLGLGGGYLQGSTIVNGERCVVIMTARVAQKSYGTEKRFLCPPPTVYFQGKSWWGKSQGYSNHWAGHDAPMVQYARRLKFCAPPVVVGIPVEGAQLQFPDAPDMYYEDSHASSASSSSSIMMDWSNRNGETFLLPALGSAHLLSQDSITPSSFELPNVPIAGRLVAKQLHISDAEDKRKRVEVNVRVRLPLEGLDSVADFKSIPVRVISKPSKKRQSLKNPDLCIHHGSCVSLFNRLRSQTVSTKYLGVSSLHRDRDDPEAGVLPWHCPGSYSGASASNSNSTCFVARTGGWDPFIIWIVDPKLARSNGDSAKEGGEGSDVPIGYPPPPSVAMHPRRPLLWNDGACKAYDSLASPTTPTGTASAAPVPIHYNQLVVLQCLTTGMVSPILRIRKVEKAGVVTGGLDAGAGTEALGDPVSQLHKVAFELYNANATEETLQATGSYLACVNDAVAIQPATPETRKMLPTVFNTLSKKSNALNGKKAAKDEYTHVRRATQPILQGLSEVMPEHAARRANSVDLEPQYLSMVHKAIQEQHAFGGPARSQSPLRQCLDTSTLTEHAPARPYAEDSAHNALLAAAWTEDVSDSSVWTIVGTDCVRYTFYHPSAELQETEAEMPAYSKAPFDFLEDDAAMPRLRFPLSQFPIVVTIRLAPHAEHDDTKGKTLTLSGRNFSRDLSVWLGSQCCVRTEFHSDSTLVCLVPAAAHMDSSSELGEKEELPILLVRTDGVIYRTGQSLFL